MTSVARPIRVVLAEDHALVRSGLAALLRGIEGVEVVGEVADGRAALDRTIETAVDVVVMDISMPGMNGLEATRRITQDRPHTRVLILSAHPNEEYVAQALRYGARGYILKGAELAEFEMALRSVARGDVFLTPRVSRQVVDEYLELAGAGDESLSPLTSRQREILQLVAEGHTSKGIAARLGLSVKTVESHRTNIMRRLDVHDVQGLVRYAVRAGLISLEG